MYLRYRVLVTSVPALSVAEAEAMAEGGEIAAKMYKEIHSKPVTKGKLWLESTLNANSPLNICYQIQVTALDGRSLDLGDEFVFCGYASKEQTLFFYCTLYEASDATRHYITNDKVGFVGMTLPPDDSRWEDVVWDDIGFVRVPTTDQKEAEAVLLLPYERHGKAYSTLPLLSPAACRELLKA